MSYGQQPYANRLNFAGGAMPSTLDHVSPDSYDMISKIIKANPKQTSNTHQGPIVKKKTSSGQAVLKGGRMPDNNASDVSVLDSVPGAYRNEIVAKSLPLSIIASRKQSVKQQDQLFPI